MLNSDWLQVPPKWENIVKKSEVYKEINKIADTTKTPPCTPPRPVA